MSALNGASRRTTSKAFSSYETVFGTKFFAPTTEVNGYSKNELGRGRTAVERCLNSGSQALTEKYAIMGELTREDIPQLRDLATPQVIYLMDLYQRTHDEGPDAKFMTAQKSNWSLVPPELRPFQLPQDVDNEGEPNVLQRSHEPSHLPDTSIVPPEFLPIEPPNGTQQGGKPSSIDETDKLCPDDGCKPSALDLSLVCKQVVPHGDAMDQDGNMKPSKIENALMLWEVKLKNLKRVQGIGDKKKKTSFQEVEKQGDGPMLQVHKTVPKVDKAKPQLNKLDQQVDKSVDKFKESVDTSLQQAIKSMQEGGKSSQQANKSMQREDKSVQKINKSMQNADKSLQMGDKSMQKTDKSMQNDDKSLRPEDKSV